MSKKIDDGPAVTRSTFIDANSGQATPEPVASEELKATIAETRAALNAELREENVSLRSELTDMTEKYASISHVISSANTRAFDAEAEATELREQLSQLRADTHGVDMDGNDIEAAVTEPSAEEDTEHDFFALVRQHLHTHGMGPQAILRAVEGRGHVERAAYIASLDSIADSMQLNTDNLRDLAQRSRVAEHLVNGG